MVRERPDGRYEISAILNENLAEQVAQLIEDEPELNNSSLVRESLRRELQRREHE